MKRWMCAALAALLLCSLTACGKTEEPARQDIFAMDTYMSLVAYGEDGQEALAAAAREINRLEQELSRTVSTSYIYKLNENGSAAVSEETANLLKAAMDYSAATGGLFDMTVAPLVSLWGITTDSPRVPSRSEMDALLPLVGSDHVHLDGQTVTLDAGCAVDLGGIAKGYASDRVAQVLGQYAVTGAAVSLGGNVYVCGQKPDGTAWSVAVQDPKKTDAYAMTLDLTDVFAVTSGGYQRYFTDADGTVYQHILDPRTGYPAQTDLLSVTVIGQNGTMADAYSTALYVMGEQAACDFWRQSGGAFDLVLITADGRVLYTPGLADHISQKGADYDFQEVPA